MLTILYAGNILDSNAEAIVNPVNCVGVMGAGLAKQIKDTFYDVFNSYQEACIKKSLHLGKVQVVERPSGLNPKFVINFPTKNHWKENSRLEYIEMGLKDLKEKVISYGINSVAIPALGCGLGSLNWKDVKPLICKELNSLTKVKIFVYGPRR